MMLDLSALEDKFPSTAEPSGKPLDIPLADIEEDPNQPRTEFSAEAMEEMTASIKARGVRQPVSLRPHPSKPGKWMLNFGARRFRGSQAAGKLTIPAFVDDTSEDFDQVIENEQRDNLKPMELALFIQRKLDEGVKKGEIARKLGKTSGSITVHLALISPPAAIEAVYRSGRCTSPRTLYELRELREKHPAEVDAWCETVDEVTRVAVTSLAKRLETKTSKASDLPAGSPTHKPEAAASKEESTLTRTATAPIAENANDGQTNQATDESDKKVDSSKVEGKGGEDHPGASQATNARGKASTDKKSQQGPFLVLVYQGRQAVVLMDRIPSKMGLIPVQFDEGGEIDEVLGSECSVHSLMRS
ncbi:MAG: ParB/RepB/Spo0J family partition protein [Pseudomonas sp.]|nr:MAG: ParB/RepB/Spo0J family partition protein [Pseudomonas sp.]